MPSSIAVSPDGKNVYVASVLSDSVAIFDRSNTRGSGIGTLTQKPGLAGCISETGAGPCTDGTGIDGANDVEVSADGKNVYVSSQISDAVAIFDRDTATGALTQKPGLAGCISETGAGPCTDGKALNGANGVSASNDTSVYVSAGVSDAGAIFDRNPTTGALTQKAGTAGCLSDSGVGCTSGKALDGVNSLVASPDGKSVYATSGFPDDAVAILDRNTITGALTQNLAGTAGCVSETGSGGSCVDGRGLDAAGSVALSPDGTGVYVGAEASNAVAVFDRDTTTGSLTQKAGTDGCRQEDAALGCADATALGLVSDVAVSPILAGAGDKGATAYASNYNSAVTGFDRSGTGALTSQNACFSRDGSSTETNYTPGACQQVDGLFGTSAIAVSPDGRSLYAVSDIDEAIAVFDREDDSKPTARITAGVEGSTGSDSATFTFTSEPGASFECRLRPLESTGYTPCSSPETYSDLRDTTYDFDVRPTDHLGRSGEADGARFLVDTKLKKPKLKSDGKQKQKGKQVIVEATIKVKEPVILRGFARWSNLPKTPVNICATLKGVLALGGCLRTGVFSGTAQIAGCEYGFGDCSRVVPRDAAASAAKKITVLVRPGNRKLEKKLVKKTLKKGKKLKAKVSLNFEDVAGNEKTKKYKATLKRK